MEYNMKRDIFLRMTHFTCTANSTACPPCAYRGNAKLQLVSKSPDSYGMCKFNGTILTIPRLHSSYGDSPDHDGYYIVAKETISAENKNTFIMAILEDVYNNQNNVSKSYE